MSKILIDEATVKLALETLELFITPNWAGAGVDKANEAHAALREAQSQPASKPWVGLTQDEFRDFASTLEYGTGGLIRAIEAKLKEKNT